MDVEIVTNVFRVMSLKQQVRKAILYWKETTQNSLERQETGKGREITQGLKYSLKFKEKKIGTAKGHNAFLILGRRQDSWKTELLHLRIRRKICTK